MGLFDSFKRKAESQQYVENKLEDKCNELLKTIRGRILKEPVLFAVPVDSADQYENNKKLCKSINVESIEGVYCNSYKTNYYEGSHIILFWPNSDFDADPIAYEIAVFDADIAGFAYVLLQDITTSELLLQKVIGSWTHGIMFPVGREETDEAVDRLMESLEFEASAAQNYYDEGERDRIVKLLKLLAGRYDIPINISEEDIVEAEEKYNKVTRKKDKIDLWQVADDSVIEPNQIDSNYPDAKNIEKVRIDDEYNLHEDNKNSEEHPFESIHYNIPYPELPIIGRAHQDNKNAYHLSPTEEKKVSKEYKANYYDKKRRLHAPVLICVHDSGEVSFEGSVTKEEFSLTLPNGNTISEKNVYSIHLIRRTKYKYFEYGLFPTCSKVEDRFLVDYNDINNLIYKVYFNRRWGDAVPIQDVSIYYCGKKIDEFKNIIRLEVIEPGNYWFEAYDGKEKTLYMYLFGEILKLYSGPKKIFYEDLNQHIHKNMFPKRINIFEDDYIKINMMQKGYKPCIICYQYCKENADKFIELGSLIPEDDTMNYVAYFQKNRLDDLAFILYCSGKTGNKMQKGYENRGFLGQGFFSKNASTLVPELADMDYPNLYKWKKSKNDIETFFEGLKALYEVCEEPFSPYKFPSYMQNAIDEEDIILAVIDYFDQEGYKGSRNLDVLYKEYYQKAIEEGVTKRRWVKEYELFCAVERLHGDAIYQYRAPWLDRQSLDIYIPSLNIGIEYQGEQHYHPVDYFGGDETFSSQKERDEVKLEKCRMHNVGIIYWRYDATIKKRSVQEAIEKCKHERFVEV